MTPSPASAPSSSLSRAGWGWLALVSACATLSMSAWSGARTSGLLGRVLLGGGEKLSAEWLDTLAAGAGAGLSLVAVVAALLAFLAQRARPERLLVGVVLVAAIVDAASDVAFLRWLLADRVHGNFPSWIQWVSPVSILAAASLAALLWRAWRTSAVRPPAALRALVWLSPLVLSLRLLGPLLSDQFAAWRRTSWLLAGMLELVAVCSMLAILGGLMTRWQESRVARQGVAGDLLVERVVGERLLDLRGWLLAKIGLLLAGIAAILVATRAQSPMGFLGATAANVAADGVCTTLLLAALWAASGLPAARGGRGLLAAAFLLGCGVLSMQRTLVEHATQQLIWHEASGQEVLRALPRVQWIVEVLGVLQVGLILVALSRVALRLELVRVSARAVALTTLGLLTAGCGALLREATLRGAIKSAGPALALAAVALLLAIAFVAGVAGVLGEVARALSRAGAPDDQANLG